MLLLVLVLAQGPRFVDLQPAMVITRSTVVAPKTFTLRGPPIVIRGNDITVDFRGATLEGAATDTAILVDGGSNITIVNARVRSYKVGILARGTTKLTLRNNDLSDNWRPRLFSLVEHESLVDWLSFHHNEKDEWLRFGAAIYLQDVQGGNISQNVVHRGMNGLLLVRSTGLKIHGNNFSFNSGLGIGLYRSSYDTIVSNQLDYNVRGYSHGFYSRGQDSADLLLYEQSSHNYVAYNSMTHGGDGVFLWAGQTTMDSGTGGANDNMFLGNDVSYATANGIEVTFSRNAIVGNRARGSEYGIWGGYSYETMIVGNEFGGNRTGIAIEHGQDNTIMGNWFDHDSTAIRLWADSIEPSDWGYPKHHDTRSRDYRITRNACMGNRDTLNIRNTPGVDTTGGACGSSDQELIDARARRYPSSTLSMRDRSAIIVDEWGPYDYSTPKLWPAGDSTRAIPLHLKTLGPSGAWRVVTVRGASVAPPSGRMGDTIVVTPASNARGDWAITVESKGQRFSYGHFEPPIAWSVQLGDSTLTWPRLDVMWYRPPQRFAFIPQSNWSLEARGSVDLPAGEYSIRTISDDAIRVWIDSTLAIDDWTPHESQVDYAALPAGTHDLRVEYRQVDGWVELRVDIIRGSERTAGSPGPH